MTFGPTELASYADHTTIGQRYAHFHPYQHDSEPDSYYRQKALRVHRPLSTVATRLQDPRLKCERNLGWSIDWAVAYIVDHLEKKNCPDATQALTTIRIRAANLERYGHLQDIPYRIFDKLDDALFAGHLKNAVFLDIKHLGADVSGATHSQGWSLDARVHRASIILNGDLLHQCRSHDIVGILIHHMIHAYFLIACGPQDQKEVDYGRLNHGLPFGKILLAIKALAAGNGRPLTALGFGHTLADASSPFYDPYRHPQRRPTPRRPAKEKWYCSHCPSDPPTLSPDEINKWYTTICSPLHSLPPTLRTSTVHTYNPRRHEIEQVPRAQTTPSTTSYEFLHQNTSVLVPASHIDTHLTIRLAFERSVSRYLELHPDIDADTFTNFLELLHTGSYGPDTGHLSGGGGGNKGPPVIKSPTDAQSAYIRADIRMYKLGALMHFPDIKRLALKRMYSHALTHEDPIAILRELYGGGAEPDADVRAWVRGFLVRGAESLGVDGEGFSGGGNGRGGGITNLAKLEAEILGFRARFGELLGESCALKYEVGEARREILKAAEAALFDRGLAAFPVLGRLGICGLGLARGLGALPGGIARGLGAPVGMGGGLEYGVPGSALGARGLWAWGVEDGGVRSYLEFVEEERERERERQMGLGWGYD